MPTVSSHRVMVNWSRGPAPDQNITVLIVDDHPLYREGLQKAFDLEDNILVIGHASNGEDAINMTRDLQPDVVLLDVNLPGMNGLQVAKQLKSERAEVALIVLTAYHNPEQVIHAIRAGASAYCSKDVEAGALVEMVRDVAGGRYIIEDKRLSERELKSWLETNIGAVAGPYADDAEELFGPLSRREMQILLFVTQGLSNKQIASKLDISQQTVKNHMTAILKKLNVEDRTQAAVLALKQGWVRLYDDNAQN